MAALINVTVQSLRRLDELGDPRSANLFLLSSPLPATGIIVLYLYFVRVWGPRWMKDKEPFRLDRVIQVYNILQVLICSYLCYKGYVLFWSWSAKPRWVCMPVDNSTSPLGMEKVYIVWLYFMVKIFDLMDTIFFTLRKKYNHMTFLHVYHHTGMVICGFMAAKYYPGGHGTFLGVVNCLVHVVMYSYYLLTSISPKHKQNLWWKKYVTQLQMCCSLIISLQRKCGFDKMCASVWIKEPCALFASFSSTYLHEHEMQFFVVGVQNLLCFLTTDCPYPKWACTALIPQCLAIAFLFADFYRKAYISKNK